MTTARFPFPSLPSGWFAVAESKELKPGGILTRRYFDRELLICRTESGQAFISPAHCPHLGAHMGKGGTMEGEHLRCPFHGFEFSREGECVHTPYGCKIPPTARLKIVPCEEKHGLILAYYDALGRAPTWSIPDLDTKGWTEIGLRTWELDSHPQETSENSVDLGHLAVIHGYEKLEIRSPARVEGPYLNVSYAMTRPWRRFKALGEGIVSEFEVHVRGLGYSLVEVKVPAAGIEMRTFVLNTPVSGERCALRAGISIRLDEGLRGRIPLGERLPWAPIQRALREIMLPMFAHDIQQDFPVWQHKAYIDPPALAGGDGPIGLYRRWAKQFYTEPAQAAA